MRGIDDPEARARMERLSRRLAAALLHEPVTRLRRSPDPVRDARLLLELMGADDDAEDAP